jgi:DNA-binding GntR family transcriptional regulator
LCEERKTQIRELYLQLAELLSREIESGARKAELTGPSETDISREFGVSLETVRKAIALLEQRKA